MNSHKNQVRYSKQITLTYPDAKKLSKEISCINKEIKAILKEDHNLEYVSFNTESLPLNEEGFRELESRFHQSAHQYGDKKRWWGTWVPCTYSYAQEVDTSAM